MPNNITLAHAQLEQLKRKLSRDETLHIMYTKVVNEYIEKGYAKEITNIVSSSKRIWYLPHHPVTNVNKIGKVMMQKEIDWHFNPPTSKHMGGAWERLIRSTGEILRVLAKEQLLTDEQLLTLMTEVEKILNNRPITPVSNDPNDPIALSPNMLLLMKSNYCLPQGLFKKEDLYAQMEY